MLNKLLDLIPFFIWCAVWLVGGGLMAVGAFRLPRRSTWVIGLTLGAVTQTWIANLFGYILPPLLAFWAGALLTLTLGLVFAWPLSREKLRSALLPTSGGEVTALIVITIAFTAIGRGLNLFDDYQNIPVISLLARGNFPLQFPLDPQYRFGYHYLLLLFSAELMRIGGIVPWNAMDFSRGLFFALTIILVYHWSWRMTRSWLAAYASAFFYAFVGGTRWLLLLLPPGLVAKISPHIDLLGSASAAVPNLAQGLQMFWDVEGSGPIHFPFAYINGSNPTLMIAHGGSAMMVSAIPMLILILYRHLRDWRGMLTMTILLAAFAQISEHAYLVAAFGLGLGLLVTWVRTRSLRIPVSLRPWIWMGLISAVFAAIQGGVLTEMVRGLFASGDGGERSSYFTVGFALQWSPTVISGHLGLLQLTNLSQAVVALLELGPVLLVLPLVAIWGWKMLRAERWWEVGLIFGMVAGFATLFLQYEGTAGITATTRLFGDMLAPLRLYAVPLVWVWARSRSHVLKQGLITLGAVSVFGGMFILGVELIAVQKPVLPMFINKMDIEMESAYWDKLEPDALIFDPLPIRAVTVFGRFTDSHVTWYEPKQSWLDLTHAPEPYALRAAGFDYFYYGLENWEEWTPEIQAMVEGSCVKLVAQVEGVRSDTDFRKSWRRLVDIRACEW